MHQTNAAAQAARLKDFEAWIERFYSLKKDTIRPIANAAKLLNQYYWNVVEAYIRPLLESYDTVENETHHLINRFKIIAITELTVMAVMPFDYVAENEDNATNESQENANFAWFCAIAILSGWEKPFNLETIKEIYTYKEILGTNDDNTELRAEYHFKNEHIQLLSTLDTRIQLPVLSTAQTWRMFYFAALAKSGNFN